MKIRRIVSEAYIAKGRALASSKSLSSPEGASDPNPRRQPWVSVIQEASPGRGERIRMGDKLFRLSVAPPGLIHPSALSHGGRRGLLSCASPRLMPMVHNWGDMPSKRTVGNATACGSRLEKFRTYREKKILLSIHIMGYQSRTTNYYENKTPLFPSQQR